MSYAAKKSIMFVATKSNKNRNELVTKSIQNVLPIASSVVLLAVFFGLYHLFHHSDWGHAIVKFLCFMASFVTLKVISSSKEMACNRQTTHTSEIILGTAILVLLFATFLPRYGDKITEPPFVDIGYTTVTAAREFFLEHKNPYESTVINVRPELADKHRGFHYGPTMFLAYGSAAYIGGIGYKATSLFFLAIAVISSLLLIKELSPKNANSQYLLASYLLAGGMLFLAERFWYELLQQGANDIMKVSLLVLGIYLFHKQHFLTAGTILGLSFSAKFSPAVFFLFLLIRKKIPIKLIIGGVIGCIPMWGFLAWNPMALLENVFIFRASLNYNSTSLYSLVTPDLHFLFKYVILGSLIYFIAKNFFKPFDLRTSLLDFTLFLIIIEVTFKEMYTNHLIWFYPFFTIIDISHRHCLIDKYSRVRATGNHYETA